MRHIIHTCMLALRLISSVDLQNARMRCLSVFDNSFLNNAIVWFYTDMGFRKKNVPRTYKVTKSDFVLNM